MKQSLIAVIAVTGCFAAASASGETLDVTWTFTQGGTTHVEATWQQDSAPTPHFSLSGDGTSIPVFNFVSTAFPPRSDVAYYIPSGPNSGVMFSTSFGGGLQLLGSEQIFTGSVTAPIFASGAFTGMIKGSGPLEFPSTLTFSAVPEPSTWGMMMIGFAGLAFVGYRRAKKSGPLCA
jgi:PEP-CTERM motif